MILVASTVILASILGVVLTLVSLPGMWFMLIVASACKLFWQDELLSWWSIGAVGALTLTAEAVELVSSSVGAAKTGGSRGAAWAAAFGAIAGAILGTPLIPIPILGTIIGAVLGAGAAAMIVELGVHQKSLKDSAKVGGGAAAGRLVSVVIKGVLALASASILIIAAIV